MVTTSICHFQFFPWKPPASISTNTELEPGSAQVFYVSVEMKTKKKEGKGLPIRIQE